MGVTSFTCAPYPLVFRSFSVGAAGGLSTRGIAGSSERKGALISGYLNTERMCGADGR